jgi:hypothetical protein
MNSGTLLTSFDEGFTRMKDTTSDIIDLAVSMAALLFEAGLSTVEGLGWEGGRGGDESS